MLSYIGCAQDKRTFISEDGLLSVILSRNYFYFTVNQSNHLPWYQTDTLAICKVTQITEEFYQIQSENPAETIQENMTVTYSNEYCINDSIRVWFHLPSDCPPIEIICFVNGLWGDIISSRYNGEKLSILIPLNTEKIVIGFEPDVQIVHEHPHGYTFQGVVAIFPSVVCFIRPGDNQVDVKLDALTRSFFERYYVNDEFIRVKDHTLYWRGIAFSQLETEMIE